MNRWTVLAVAVGVLIAALVKLAPVMSISPLVCMVAFAVYFGSGGGTGGLVKSIASLVAGAVWMVIANIIVISNQATLENYRWIFFGVVGIIVVLQTRVALLSYLTAGLAGVSMAAGTPGFRPFGLLVIGALVLGSVAGFVADSVANVVAKRPVAGGGV